MKVTVRTPNHTLLDQIDSDAVTLPGSKGDLQILNNHVPILSSLRKGQIKVASEEDLVFDLDEGFFIFSDNNLEVVIFKTSLSEDELKTIESKAIALRNKQLKLDDGISEQEFIDTRESQE